MKPCAVISPDVILANAGIHFYRSEQMDSRVRGNDAVSLERAP